MYKRIIKERDSLGRVKGHPPILKKCILCNKNFMDSFTKGSKYCSRKCYWKNMSTYVGEKASHWRGTNIGYTGLHVRIRKQLGTPKHCSKCGLNDPKRKYQWSNISGKYKHNLSDWARLCVPCHKKFDLNRIRNACIS